MKGYLAVEGPGGISPEWRGWSCSEVRKLVRCVNTSPLNTTTRAVDIVSLGGSPTIDSPHKIVDISPKCPRSGCVIKPTREKDHVVDEDNSVGSDDMSDMEV